MLKPKNEWPNSPTATSVLFVAQAMHELLDSQQHPSFRVKSLDLIGLLQEVARVCRDVEAAGVDRRNAEAVIEECYVVLANDPVAQRICPGEVKAFEDVIRRLKDKRFSLSDFVHHAHFFTKNLASSYKLEIENLILEKYRENKNRRTVKAAISSYLSHLINSGYSRDFLLSRVEERFFNGPIKKAEKRTISRFFAEFTGVEKCFAVWAIAPMSTSNFLRKLGEGWPEKIEGGAVPADVQAWVDKQSADAFKSPVVIQSKIYAHDPFSAAHKFNDQLRRAKGLTALVQSHLIIQWSLTQYVRTPKATKGISASQFQSILREFRLDSGGGGENKIRSQVKRIPKFDIESQERIYSALGNGKTAKDSLNGEQSIISTWSSFEILVRNPAPGIVRITHYKDALIPVICLRYAKQYIRALYLSIRRADKAGLIASIAPVVCEHDNPLLKFTLMMMVDEFADAQEAFFERHEASPLLQFHIWNTRRKFKTPKDHLASLLDHERRVGCQIERIYRARNQIVHAGLREPYLESVARNANEYFRAAIGPLIVRGRNGDGLGVDNVLAEFSLEYIAHKHRLSLLAGNQGFSAAEVSLHFQ